jgi:hypothetical protein
LVPVSQSGHMALDRSTGYIWVTGEQRGVTSALVQFDTSTDTVLNRESLGCCPGSIAVNRGFVWVTDSAGGTVVQVSALSGDLIRSIPVGPGPSGVVAGDGIVWVTTDVR